MIDRIDYMSLHVAVTICDTLVNTRTHKQTAWPVVLGTVTFFFSGQARPNPVWPAFSLADGEKERPDRVRPGLANEKERAQKLAQTVGLEGGHG